MLGQSKLSFKSLKSPLFLALFLLNFILKILEKCSIKSIDGKRGTSFSWSFLSF